MVTANYVDPTEDNNPYREAAFDTLSIRLTDSSSDTTVVITEIIEEITTGGEELMTNRRFRTNTS